jgi:CxxC-x17-CxxC domain-containing protein
MATFADKTLKCMECNQDFIYTAAEQELHQSLGYQNEPKRCNPCREAKRQRKGPAPAGGAAPAGGGGGGPRPPRGNGGGGGGGDRGPRGGGGGPPRGRDNRGPREGGQMADVPAPSREYFMAICNECGKEAQLPFKPRGDRPIFCSECFDKKRTPT